MAMTTTESFLFFIGIAGVLFVLRYFKSGLPLPPGPPGDPIIGHIRVMPTSYQHFTFTEWAKKYGDIIHTKVLHKDVVVLSSLAAANELFEVRGSNYSSRPRTPFQGELMGFDSNLVFLPYGNRWRKQRRMLQQSFNSNAVVQFRPMEQYFTNIMLNDLLKAGDQTSFKHRIEMAVISITVMLTYGIHVTSKEDSLVRLSEEVIEMAISAGAPGTTLMDMIPILKYVPGWVPGAGYQALAARSRKVVKECLDYPFGLTKANVESGKAVPSVVGNLLNDVAPWMEDGDDDFEFEVKNIGMVLYIAGVETTVTTTLIFLLAMLLNPDVLKKAQEEIDRVVGPNRLPDFSDRADLHYVGAVFKETFRWHAPVPLGIPHTPLYTDEYNGYKIPGDSTVLANIWAMTQDEDTFSDPQSFKPERFLKTTDKSTVSDDCSIVYGFGRRICPGRFFADDSMWLIIACIIATFDLRPGVDAKGRELQVEAKFKHGSTSQPEDFPCRFIPRSEKAASLIRQNMPSGGP